MTGFTRLSALFTLLALGACGGGRDRPLRPATGRVSASYQADWRLIATPADRERLRNWRQTWVAAIAEARGADDGAMVREDTLFVPEAALAEAVPPAGAYRCRVFKLGAQGAATRKFATYPYFACRVDVTGDTVQFYKDGGSQRPVGSIFRESPARAVFLGTLVLGDELSAMRYGRDASRDMAGFVERIGARRWRIVLPQPRFESQLDMIELVPAG